MNSKIVLVISVLALVVSVFAFGMANSMPDITTPTPDTTVGAVATNQPTEPFYFAAGLTSQIKPFNSTTTIVCMFQNPSIATSTFTARWSVLAATTTTTVLGIATTTNANRYATTTAVLARSVAASTRADSSYVGANDQNLIGPGEWVQVGYGAGTTLPTIAQLQSGMCSVTFFNIR